MNKPKDYDRITIGWESVTPGGHKCRIIKVEETTSSAGNQMLVVTFDLHEDDTQPKLFSNQYIADQQAGRDPKWRGVQSVVTDERTEYGSANLKRFNTAVEESNPGFQVQWGPNYAAGFQNALVGIVFRLEDYTAPDGQMRAACKPFRFCRFDTALEVEAPERKTETPKQDQPDPYRTKGFAGAQTDDRGYWKKPTATQTPQPWQPAPQQTPQFQQAAMEDFMKIPDNLQDEGLPFN